MENYFEVGWQIIGGNGKDVGFYLLDSGYEICHSEREAEAAARAHARRGRQAWITAFTFIGNDFTEEN